MAISQLLVNEFEWNEVHFVADERDPNLILGSYFIFSPVMKVQLYGIYWHLVYLKFTFILSYFCLLLSLEMTKKRRECSPIVPPNRRSIDRTARSCSSRVWRRHEATYPRTKSTSSTKGRVWTTASWRRRKPNPMSLLRWFSTYVSYFCFLFHPSFELATSYWRWLQRMLCWWVHWILQPCWILLPT